MAWCSFGMADQDREDDSEWQFSVDEVGEKSARSETESVIERLRTADPEPGSPSLESSVFVLLGAVLTISVFLLLAGVI